MQQPEISIHPLIGRLRCKWSAIQPKYFNKIIATIPIVFLPVIVALIIHMLSLSSLLLLRNPPNTFAFIPLPAMSLSSLNRSNSKAFRHIMPYSAPVCEGMHYHKTGVPWQMKSTLIIVLFLLVLPRNALFCEGLWDSCSLL